MRSHTTWSITFIRWRGLRVRLHMFFLLFALFTLFLGWQADDNGGLMIAGASLLILLASVLLHEFGHYCTAMRFGGDGDDIVLGPFGGLASMHPPVEARHECLMHLAGPAVNLALCVLAGAVLATQGTAPLLGMLHPLQPEKLVDDGESWLQALKLAFWINWMLFLVNLLPAFPFDGGRALHAGLSMIRPDASPRRAAGIVALIAKVAALGLSIVAVFLLFSQRGSSTSIVPLWFPLLLLAIFVYFSAKQEEDRALDSELDDDVFGYDFSQGYTSLERSEDDDEETAGPVRRWLEQRREAHHERQREIEADEERRVDEILSRLHNHGMESLSEEDRSVLKRVSDRYRQRDSS